MPRQHGDGKFESFPTEELFNRNLRRQEKSTAHRQKRQIRKENVCMKCELPTYEASLNQERRRKKSNKYQHCPSCNCHLNYNNYERYMESMAMLEEYENYLANPQNSTMKRMKTPFSIPTGINSRMTGEIQSFKRGQNTEQNQSSKIEYPEEMHTVFMNMINSAVADENGEFYDKSTHRKEHDKEDGQLQYNQDESELDSDCSKKTFKVHCHLKKDKRGCFEKIPESIEKCEITRNEELKHNCEELNQLTVETKQIKSQKDSDSQKKKAKFDKSAIIRPNEISSDRKVCRKREGMHQRHKIEPSTSCHTLPKDDNDSDNDIEVDFLKQSQLQHEFKGNGNSKISRHSTIENLQMEKLERNNIEIMSLAKENEFQSKNKALAEDRRNLYGGGDLDLHTCKSYIVDLIDRALSKQLRTHMDERKVDLNKNSPSWQEMCFEVTRALQGDYCQSFTQNLDNFQENNIDNVKLLKRFRWAYIKHIQEQLRSLEKIIDICSPRHAEKEAATS
ncbi:uncharacterized protein LOC127283584 isoform X2 [Leptopilina boulardi]|uniref:uncharacterized protein LOC127283584 isoform X2 n=1 Tax=Leptopilina boulardi TaxID=63433 RepID=UPI0021F53ED6|nr:uncharacterized protein LOC127283584 isoform X2 [Leptopilina boulardi]